jgi:hypothetical protein
MQTDDKASSLSEIAAQQGDTIISSLVKIQDSADETRDKAIIFLKNLQCLQLPPHLRCEGSTSKVKVRRKIIDAALVSSGNYLSLSYTWKPSKHEDKTNGS